MKLLTSNSETPIKKTLPTAPLKKKITSSCFSISRRDSFYFNIAVKHNGRYVKFGYFDSHKICTYIDTIYRFFENKGCYIIENFMVYSILEKWKEVKNDKSANRKSVIYSYSFLQYDHYFFYFSVHSLCPCVIVRFTKQKIAQTHPHFCQFCILYITSIELTKL